MAYNVYVVAAAEFMAAFYDALFDGESISVAVKRGRERLRRQPMRPSPKGEIPLSDWMVPVPLPERNCEVPVSQQRPESIRSRPGVSLDRVLDALDTQREADTQDGFVGRDLEFFQLEVACRAATTILLHGPGGIGKTALARAFASWRAATGATISPGTGVILHSFEPGVAAFDLEAVVGSIGLEIFGPEFAQLEADQRRQATVHVLRDNPFVLIWDNLESVYTMPDPSGATPALSDSGREEYERFLADIDGGLTRVLVTSRSSEDWLGQDVLRIEVGGLRGQEVAKYADLLLAPFPRGQARRSDPSFEALLERLQGHPLSMRVILPQLEHSTPDEILTGLTDLTAIGDTDARERGRTESLASSVRYSLVHLDQRVRELLLAGSLLEGVLDAAVLSVASELPSCPPLFAACVER